MSQHENIEKFQEIEENTKEDTEGYQKRIEKYVSFKDEASKKVMDLLKDPKFSEIENIEKLWIVAARKYENNRYLLKEDNSILITRHKTEQGAKNMEIIRVCKEGFEQVCILPLKNFIN
jgi:hypothetical protein